MNESSHKHKPQICRLCLAQTVTRFSLIDNHEFSAMLEALTSLRISPTDDISTIMCLKCRLNLKLAFTIQQNMLKAEQRFREHRGFVPIKKEADDEEALEAVGSKLSEQDDDNGVSWASSDFEKDDEHVATEAPLESAKIETKKKIRPEGTCDICGLVLSTRSSVKRHKLNCHRDKVKCHVCKKQINPRHFKQHADLHEQLAEMAKKPEMKVGHQCSVCRTFQLTRISLRRHLVRCHQYARCLICHKDMPKEEYKSHSVVCKQRAEPKTHICDICGIHKATKANLHRHKKTHVLSKCPICAKHVKIESLKKHVDLHNEGVYKCDICGKVKPSKDSLSRHKTAVHESDQSRCPICGLVMLEFNLKKHMERHNKTTFTMCELCGKSVYTPDLAVHMRHNHTDGNFKCKQCDQVFEKIHLLQKHRIKEHKVETANYMCDTCGRKFSSGGALQKHVQSAHLKLRPHVCDVCKVGFSTPYSLKTHRRQHTNETPYKCEFCGDGFRQKVSLKTHLKSKHDVKEELTHECSTCGRKFESEFAVIAHARVHK